MALNQSNLVQPPEVLEGENGLWELYQRTTKIFLVLKLLEDLQTVGVGTNEIEAEARHRSEIRKVKLGKVVDGFDVGIEKCSERDVEYVRGLLKLRSEQVRKDWKVLKKITDMEKGRLRKSVKNERELNMYKRMILRIQKRNEKLFLEGRKKHQDKVKWLQRKHTSKNVPKKVLIKEEKEQWLNRIAAGKKVDVEHQIPIFGDIPEPPEKAKKVLSLPVKHKVADKVTVKDIKFEANVNNCKTRWGRRSSGSPEEQAEDLADNQTNILPTEDEYYWGIINENKEREIYDPESKTLDLGKLKCTDLRNNPRLHMPGPRPQREETMMQAKKEMYIEATKMYISKNCYKDGSQREGGLDDEFKEGLEEIEEYKKTYNVVISTTDKSGKYTLNSRDSYKAQGDKHVSGDKEISWDDVTTIQNEVICHSKALCNVFKISNQWGEKEEARTRRAMAEKSTIIPQMVITQKDHKPIQDDGLPKTRAMCGASQSINQRVSDLLTDVLQALFSSELSNESLSTESYIHKIDKMNKDIREGRIVAPDLMVGSLDVEALYPSTDIYKAAEILKN